MRYKRGRETLSINLLYEIADKLGIDPASLLPGTNPEQKPEFGEYIRNIVREEIEKAIKKNRKRGEEKNKEGKMKKYEQRFTDIQRQRNVYIQS